MADGRSRLAAALLGPQAAPPPMSAVDMILADLDRPGGVDPRVLDAAIEAALAQEAATPMPPTLAGDMPRPAARMPASLSPATPPASMVFENAARGAGIPPRQAQDLARIGNIVGGPAFEGGRAIAEGVAEGRPGQVAREGVFLLPMGMARLRQAMLRGRAAGHGVPGPTQVPQTDAARLQAQWYLSQVPRTGRIPHINLGGGRGRAVATSAEQEAALTWYLREHPDLVPRRQPWAAPGAEVDRFIREALTAYRGRGPGRRRAE